MHVASVLADQSSAKANFRWQFSRIKCKKQHVQTVIVQELRVYQTRNGTVQLTTVVEERAYGIMTESRGGTRSTRIGWAGRRLSVTLRAAVAHVL